MRLPVASPRLGSFLLSRLISLVFVLLLMLVHLGYLPSLAVLVQRLDAMVYDLRMQLAVSGHALGLPPIVVIDIDESSLLAEGQWPWQRQRVAVLLDRLFAAGSAVVALDMTFAEPETNPADRVLAALPAQASAAKAAVQALHEELDGDAALAKVLRHREVVLGYTFHAENGGRQGIIRPATLAWQPSPLQHPPDWLAMQGYSANVSLLAGVAAHQGFFNARPDPDGVLRRVPLLLGLDGQWYPSLALAAARAYRLANVPIEVSTANQGTRQVITQLVFDGNPQQAIRTDALGQVLVPFLGKSGVFPHVSAADVLQGKRVGTQALPNLQGAIVLVGTSAQGLVDLRATPVQASYPGVEIQASVLHGLLHPELLPFNPDWLYGAMTSILLLLGLGLLLLYPYLSPSALLLVASGLLLVLIAGNMGLWWQFRLDMPLVLPTLLVLVVTSLFAGQRLVREYRERQRIQAMFGQYVPAEHIRQLLAHYGSGSLGRSERREMTVLFADIRGFTALAEQLDPTQVQQLLNHYFTPVTEAIFRHGGTVDKYMGDMVMAFWGAPVVNANHAQQAVLAALAIQDVVSTLQPQLATLGIAQTLQVGIGIHTGEMAVGDMGSAYRRAYTVLGDAVNVGARLEELTKHYGAAILVSGATMRGCPELTFHLVDEVQLRGRSEPIHVYAPLPITPTMPNHPD